MEQAAIQTVRLGKTFSGNVEAVRDLTASVPRGVVYGLIGRNGAGKTTLIRMLMGLLRPTSGQAMLLGRQMMSADLQHRSRIAYVSQEFHLPQLMTTQELCYSTSVFYPNWDEDLAKSLARRFEVDLTRPVGQLSGGQRCKAAILVALATRAEVLILDEPAAALDPIARRHLVEELIDVAVRSDGRTILFSTHIVSDLERVADHIGIMEAGRLVVNAPLEQLQATIRRVQMVFPGDSVPEGFVVEGALKTRVSGPVLSAIARVDGEEAIECLRRRSGARVNAFPLGLEDLFINLLGEAQASELVEAKA